MDYVDIQFEDRSGVWVTVSNVTHNLKRTTLSSARLRLDIQVEG